MNLLPGIEALELGFSDTVEEAILRLYHLPLDEVQSSI